MKLVDLKIAMIRRGVRQNHMALELGWDPAKLSRIMNGMKVPTAEERCAISKYLKLPESDIFPEPESKSGSSDDAVVTSTL